MTDDQELSKSESSEILLNLHMAELEEFKAEFYIIGFDELFDILSQNATLYKSFFDKCHAEEINITDENLFQFFVLLEAVFHYTCEKYTLHDKELLLIPFLEYLVSKEGPSLSKPLNLNDFDSFFQSLLQFNKPQDF